MFLLLLRENNVSFNFSLAILLYSLVTARINRLTKQLFFILYKFYIKSIIYWKALILVNQ